MLYRFPPIQTDPADASFLVGKNGPFAKLKIESKAGQRTVLMTEHTLIFVLKGIKLLHFATGTLEVSADKVFLLKKGIYVMAEYLPNGERFEALMLFLPVRLLSSIPLPPAVKTQLSLQRQECIVFPVTGLVRDFKNQLRAYFEYRVPYPDTLISLKQQEILLLLMSTHPDQITAFIRSALKADPEEMESTLQRYLLQPVTVAELAALCNRSLASFKREFQRRFGDSPKAWLNIQRLHHALLLLNNTEKQIAEIAMESGFESASYFIRVFKKTYGTTPKSFRARIAID